MKKGKFILICLLAAAALPSARAANDYLRAYSSWVSADAYQAALEATPAASLDAEAESIYRLGFAAGYDTARGIPQVISLPGEEAASAMVRASLIGTDEPLEGDRYIVNTASNIFHRPGCQAEKNILPENRQEVRAASMEDLKNMGYRPCGICFR